MKRKQIPNYYPAFGEQLETEENMRKASQPVNTAADKLSHCGAPLSLGSNKNELLTSKDELHTFVIGETGAGKTRRVILPMIQLMAKTGESMILSDPKGELYRKTAANLRAHGYEVHVINLKEPYKSSRWNPLGTIEKMFRSSDKTDRENGMNDLLELADQLKRGVSDKDDPLWGNAFGQIFEGIARLILEYGGAGTLTFPNIVGCFEQINKQVEEHRGRRRFSEQFSEWWDGLSNDNLIKSKLHGYISCVASERTFGSHQTTFYSGLAPFNSTEGIQHIVSCSDFSMSSIGKRSSALFLIVPDNSESTYFLSTLLVKQIYNELLRTADLEKDGMLPVHVNFILDEFANFTKMEGVSAMLTASRSRGIRFTLVCQSMEQLYDKYGPNTAETLMANCRVWIYLNSKNIPFLERLCKLAGDYYNPETNTRWPLLAVPQLARNEIGDAIIFNDHCRPFRGFLPDYEDYDFGKGTLKQDSVLTEKKLKEPKAFDLMSVLPAPRPTLDGIRIGGLYDVDDFE